MVISKMLEIIFKINDSVKSSIQKGVLSHPHMIKSPIANDFITVKCYDRIRGVKTKLHQKVIILVSMRDLHIYMTKKGSGFSMA